MNRNCTFAFASFRKFLSVICERLVGLVSFKTNVSETAGQIHLSDNVRCYGGMATGSIMCDVRCIKRVYKSNERLVCAKTQIEICLKIKCV